MAPKKEKEKEKEAGGRGDARAAIFALFEKRGVEASDVSDEVVIAEAKKHGREPSHNAVVKYRSLFRLERGISPARVAKPAKPKATAKSKAAKSAAKPKAAKPKPKPKAEKSAKPAKKPAKQRARGDGRGQPDASSVDQLTRVLDIEPIGSA